MSDMEIAPRVGWLQSFRYVLNHSLIIGVVGNICIRYDYTPQVPPSLNFITIIIMLGSLIHSCFHLSSALTVKGEFFAFCLINFRSFFFYSERAANMLFV